MDSIQWSNFVFSTYFTLFNVVIYFIQLNESATIDDLTVACGIKYKGSNQDVFFDTVPENCSSIIINSNDFPDEKAFCDMVKTKKAKIPFFLIEDSVSFDTWVAEFDTISTCVRTYTDIIDKYELDGIFFDNLYPEQLTDNFSNDVISNGIAKLFDSIKEHYHCKNKDIMLGVVLPWNSEIIKHGFCYEIIDSSVDAYLCNSTNYLDECPENGGSLSTPCKIRETARHFYTYTDSLQYMTKSKIVMELQLYVKDAEYNTEISYGESCALCPGTVVCQDTLKSLYLKGLVINEFEFAGAYIRYCNQDDIRGWCYCGHKTPFPGVGAIAAGVQGVDLEYIECLSFGVPGIYRPDNICKNFITTPLPPVVEPLPVVKSLPVIESLPVVESPPVVQLTPLIEPMPILQSMPLIQPMPLTESPPLTGSPPVSEGTDIFILIFPPDTSPSVQKEASTQTGGHSTLSIDTIAQMLIPPTGI